MSVALLPEYTNQLNVRYVPLDFAPNFVRSSGATRWHRARSGHRWNDGRVSYSYWCGANYGDMGVDQLPAGDDLCATCEGRWEAQEENNLRFTPLASLPPRRCPASRSAWVPFGHIRGAFTCVACGAEVRLSRTGWYGSNYYVVAIHKTGPNLVAGCKVHGWNLLRMTDDGIRCACGRTS